MKKQLNRPLTRNLLRLLAGAWLLLSPGPIHGADAPIIVDHTCTDLGAVPASAIQEARASLHIAYGHTSHGSQLITGMQGMVGFMNRFQDDAFADNLFTFNSGGVGGALDLRDTPFSGASDLGAPNRTAWATATRSYLAAHPEVNVIIWSWCGQVDGSQADIQQYLDLMTGLEADFPAVQFVYMTGHLNGGGATGNVNVRNQQIRDYCHSNNKILYDFADIESYDPDGLVDFMSLHANDECYYDADGNGSRESNWAQAWQASHTQDVDWFNCSPAHTSALNGNLKAYAAWHLWARLAGWGGSPTGRTVNVATITQLRAAIDDAQDNDTILLADGVYQTQSPMVLDGADNVTIRSASGDAAAVTLRGRSAFTAGGSYDELDDILRIRNCDGVHIERLTFTEAHGYGIKLELDSTGNPNDIHVAYCRFLNIGTRHIKGTRDPNDSTKRIRGGSIRHCSFENTVTPPVSGGWHADGNYVAAIDVMSIAGWTIEDNEFRGIQGRTGEGRSAIFVWVDSEDLLIQRNRIVNCDRGITLGLSGDIPGWHVDGAIVRNNFIVVDSLGSSTADSGIEAWTARGLRIYNNTIWRADRWDWRGIRLIDRIEDVEIVNNLVRGQLTLDHAMPLARNDHNVFADLDTAIFVSAATGDLRLTQAATSAINAGAVLTSVTDDFSGIPRDSTPNIGASEYVGVVEDDIQPPSVPQGLVANAVSTSRVNVGWNASTDNVAVAGYRLLRDGVQVYEGASNSYADSGLQAATTYSYSVRAFDPAGNQSAPSEVASVTTPGPGDPLTEIYARALPTIDAAMKAHLRSIKVRGDAQGRIPGRLGQWGDSITDSWAYLSVTGTNGISIPPSSGHDYQPVLRWMGASQCANGNVGCNDRTNPLWAHKGGSYCNQSGWTLGHALGAVGGAIARAQLSWSLIMYGTNDMRSGWNAATYESRLQRLLQVSIDAGVVPVVSTIPPCRDYDTRVAEVNSIVRRVATDMHVPCVDLHLLYTTLHPDDWDGTVVSNDGVHPSAPFGGSNLSDEALLNDGYVARTVLTLDMAELIKSVVFDNSPPAGPDLPIVVASSPTHPYNAYTADLQPRFVIAHDSGALPTGYSYVLDTQPGTVPDQISEGTATTVDLAVDVGGTYFFHVRANSALGWGPTVHYPIKATEQPLRILRHDPEVPNEGAFKDTFVSQMWGGDDNLGAAASLNIYNDNRRRISRGLLFFNLAGVAGELDKAELVVWTEQPVDRDMAWELYENLGDWAEGDGTWNNNNNSGVTWATAPAISETAVATGTLPNGASEIRIDVTATVLAWMAGTRPNYGFALLHSNQWVSLPIVTREYGDSQSYPSLWLWGGVDSDMVPPTAPSGLAGEATSSSTIELTWTAATDASGIKHYRILRDGVEIAVSQATSYTDSGLWPLTSYEYHIVAVDMADNAGPQSAPVTVTTPEATPTPVTQLTARHYSGQTFLTWPEAPAVAGATPDAMTMGEVRTLRQTWQGVSYRVYRSTSPITSVAGRTPVKTVGVLTAWNTEFNGRENTASREGASFRYVIELDNNDMSAPSLANRTAVCAYNPPAAGVAYYAVTTVTNGVEDTSRTAANTVQVAETQGQGVPILQRVETRTNFHYTTGTSTHYYYTRWESPPNSNIHGRPVDYMVVIPEVYKDGTPLPAEVSFHGWSGNLMGMSWWMNFAKGMILITTNQEPYDWWTGYHELRDILPRTQANWGSGVVRPYTQNRVNSFFDWAAGKWDIDRSRSMVAGVSMGGSGSIMYGIRNPDRIAWVNSWVGVHVPAESPTFASSYTTNYGETAWNVLYEDGVTPAWSFYDDDWYLRNHVSDETPFITFSNGKNDTGIGWPQAVKFARALQDTRRPHIFYWGMSGHLQRTNNPPDLDGDREQASNPIDIRCDQSLPAFTNCSLDDDPGDGAVDSGDSAGQLNAFLYWETTDIVDERDHWAMTVGVVPNAPAASCTLSLTPRRVQKLAVVPGMRFRWTNRALASGEVVQSGHVTADAYGLLTIDNLAVDLINRSGGGNRIEIAADDPGLPSGIANFEIGKTPSRLLHVALNGNDSTGDGSSAAPWRTISRAVGEATPGTAIRVHPGTYTGRTDISNLAGTTDAPIWIGGVPGEARPVLGGSSEALHLTRVRYLVLHDLEITGASDNGINIDDGGDFANNDATRHLVLRNLYVHNIGTTGNQDGIKLSGVNDYFILGCEITRCGGDQGSGIDHVGCHGGVIAGNYFHDLAGNAVQCKGGSEDIEIRGNRFIECGERALNIGGSSGFQYFRAPLSATHPNFEARDIRVSANVIKGGVAALAFVGAVDCQAVNNTIITPHNWLIRILQETTSTGDYTFSPCGNNLVANNLFYYDGSDLSVAINVGSNTDPQSFTFTHNLWFNYTAPSNSNPNLPVTETNGVRGINPMLMDPAADDFRLREDSPARGAGNAATAAVRDFNGALYGDQPAIGAFSGESAAGSDNTPPTTPTGLAGRSGDGTIHLTWLPSTDPAPGQEDVSGLAGYRIYRDGNAIATSAAAAYIDTSPTLGSSHAYSVSAYDVAGNESAPSPPLTMVAHDEARASYTEWALARFGPEALDNPALSGPLADPDGHGVCNLYRYAFDLPATGRVEVPFQITVDSEGGTTRVALEFQRKAHAPDIRYVMETSADLTQWTVVETINAGYPREISITRQPLTPEPVFYRISVEPRD